MNVREFLNKYAPNKTDFTIAHDAGITPSTFYRRVRRDTLPAGDVIAIAQVYGRNPVQALIDMGYIDPQPLDLRAVATDDLLDELKSRIHG